MRLVHENQFFSGLEITKKKKKNQTIGLVFSSLGLVQLRSFPVLRLDLQTLIIDANPGISWK